MKYRLNGEEFDNQRDYRKALKESEEEENAYDLWSEEEDSELEELSEENEMSVSELADHFKRTDLGITSRLAKLSPNCVIRTNYYKNDLKQSEGFYRNNLKRYETRWYENGQIKSQGDYKQYDEVDEAYAEGNWSEWYENGQKKTEINYKTGFNSNLPLISIEWYESGQKKFEENFKTGMLNEWYENGQIKLEGNYSDTLFNEGQFCDFDQWNRDNAFKKFFKKGRWTEWYLNGYKKIEGCYAFDYNFFMGDSHSGSYKKGKWTEWDEDGVLTLEAYFKDGECISGDC